MVTYNAARMFRAPASLLAWLLLIAFVFLARDPGVAQKAEPQKPAPTNHVSLPKTPEDIVNYLIPNNSAFPARLADIAKPDAISALLDAQQHSTGAKANAVAFLLIVLDQNTDANRQRLFDALRSCKTDPDNCDEDVVQYLAYLFEHGDKLVLNPLFDAVQFDDDGLAKPWATP